MKIIILAGGGGTRLFPLSRKSFPKQFLQIVGKKSLFLQTIDRFKKIVAVQDIIVVTNKDYLHYVREELQANECGEATVLAEPEKRNTAPALAYAACYCREKLGVSDSEVLFAAPADHIIQEGEESFAAAVKQAEEVAGQGKMVIFGVKPDKPETGYGYIETGEKMSDIYSVISFTEKPDTNTAKLYLAAENYYWNSGMFCLSIDCLLEELALYKPELAVAVRQGFSYMTDNFKELPDLSIDYAVAEKSHRSVMLPLKVYWNDIGSWDAVKYCPKVLQGDCLMLDCKKNLVFGNARFIAGIGLEELLIVDAQDMLLIVKRGQSQRVREIAEKLEETLRQDKPS